MGERLDMEGVRPTVGKEEGATAAAILQSSVKQVGGERNFVQVVDGENWTCWTGRDHTLHDSVVNAKNERDFADSRMVGNRCQNVKKDVMV